MHVSKYIIQNPSVQAAVPEAYIVQMAGEQTGCGERQGEGREVYIQLEAWVEVTTIFSNENIHVGT